MTVPLRGRLAQIIREAWHRSRAWAPGVQLPVEEFADALIASEEWHAREAVVSAAEVYVAVRWGQHTTGGQHATRERETWHALRASLARLDAVKGEETSNGG